MKTILMLSVALVAGNLAAQSQRVEPNDSAFPDWQARGHVLVVRPENRREIEGRRVIYSGLAVDLIKHDNPLQPSGPSITKDRSPEDGPIRDPKGNIIGWSILSIRF
jgi:hypothetical protein